MIIKKSYPFILLFIITFICGLVILNLFDSDVEPTTATLEYNSKEIVLIYLADSKCLFCHSDIILNKIRAIDDELSRGTSKTNVGYKKIGISIDIYPRDGFSYFENVLEFNELIIGSGWSNTGVLRYIYTEFQSNAATPQLIITTREYNRITIPSSKETYRGLKSEKIIHNLIGDEILKEIDFQKLLNQ